MGRIKAVYGGSAVGVGALEGQLPNGPGLPTFSVSGSAAPGFIIEFPVTAVARETIVTAANNTKTFSVVDASLEIQTAGAAGDSTLAIRTAGAGAGTIIASFAHGTATIGTQPSDAAGSVTRGPVRLVSGTDGIFTDKTGTGVGLVGRVILHCINS